MNKKINSLLISLITLFILSQFFFKSELLINTIYSSINLFFYNLFPNIFVFFIITDILNKYNFPYYLEKILGNIIHKIYKLPKSSSYIIFMSLFSGFPSNSKLIKEGLENHRINEFDATKLLTMTHFSNPLFIIYTVGINFFHDKKIGIIILISHYITNFIIGFLFRNIFKVKENNYESKFINPKNFMEILKSSINNTFIVLFNVLGIIIFFSILTTIINNYLNLNPFYNTILNGILEITNGLKLLSNLSISKIKAATLATFFISFGGFSIHMQVMSILNKYKLNYCIYLISRILHASISSLITFIILINSY